LNQLPAEAVPAELLTRYSAHDLRTDEIRLHLYNS
jgi:hypothetical protein